MSQSDTRKSGESSAVVARASWRRPLGWIAGGVALGYGASFLVHLIAVLICSFMVVSGARLPEVGAIAGMIGSGLGDGTEGGFQEIFDTSVDVPTGADSILSVSPAIVPPGEGELVSQPLLSAGSVAKSGGNGVGEGSGDGTASGDGTGHKFAMPSAGTVTEGSFTVWTVPADPKPNENYSIIMQIKLPKRAKSYRTADLTGTVVGTDRYRQDLPGNQPKYLPVKQSSVQLEILVPGAAELVQDTIRIKSKMLKEEQELRIVF
ncbi:MAG: hypothetical protein AB7O26_01770 [Planctomycetaceae bacterium]